MDYKTLVDNNVNSYNSYSVQQRNKMVEGTLSKIELISEEITNIYRESEAKRYPLRMSSDEKKVTAGESKRAGAFQFVNLIAPNLEKKLFASEQQLTNEIKKSLDVDDRDYISALFDAYETLVPQADSKFSKEMNSMKKDYLDSIGYKDVSDKIAELKTRRAEFEFIFHAIVSGDDYIMFPRHYENTFDGVDLNRNPKAKDLSFKLLPFVNRSLSFLSQKKVRVKA